MPQLFVPHDIHGNGIVVAANIVNNILITGLPDKEEILISTFKDLFILRPLSTVPGQLQFCRLTINQDDHYSWMVKAHNKCSALQRRLLARAHERIINETLCLEE